MRPRSLLLLACIVAVLGLAACGQDRKVVTPGQRAKTLAAQRAAEADAAARKKAREAEQLAPELAGENAYRLNALDRSGKACTTGLHEFASRELLCLGLQDSALNHDCAEEGRRLRFASDCAPERAWNETLLCRLSFVEKNAAVDGAGGFHPRALRKQALFCAGRSADGQVRPGEAEKESPLYEDVLGDFESRFVPAQQPGRVRSHFALELYRRNAAGEKLPLSGKLVYEASENGFKLQQGDIENAPYKYVLRCENVPACP